MKARSWGEKWKETTLCEFLVQLFHQITDSGQTAETIQMVVPRSLQKSCYKSYQSPFVQTTMSQHWRALPLLLSDAHGRVLCFGSLWISDSLYWSWHVKMFSPLDRMAELLVNVNVGIAGLNSIFAFLVALKMTKAKAIPTYHILQA